MTLSRRIGPPAVFVKGFCPLAKVQIFFQDNIVEIFPGLVKGDLIFRLGRAIAGKLAHLGRIRAAKLLL